MLRLVPQPEGPTTTIFQVYAGMKTRWLGCMSEPLKPLGPQMINNSLPDCASVRQ